MNHGATENTEAQWSKEIWLGPLLGSNRPRLIARCAGLAANGQADNFLYLAASHPLLEVVTEGVLAAGGGLWGELPVYLFRGFVRRVLSTAVDRQTGARFVPRVPIDREELPLKRSLVSQILRRLADSEKLSAIAPLVHHDGCVNTIAKLIGEIQRAGKTPDELQTVVEARSRDFTQIGNDAGWSSVPLQIDFDREIALIYSTYCETLARFGLTEEDADQLRALSILRGESDGCKVNLPWLQNVRLLVLDGFFDFTPVQGEMLRCLIPDLPEVVVNLNHDERNPEIFRAFHNTLDQLSAIAEFNIRNYPTMSAVSGALSGLRDNLFNPEVGNIVPTPAPETESRNNPTCEPAQDQIRLLACTDRRTEIRAIAKEIKRLVLMEGYGLSDVALVVREHTSYVQTIVEIMREEGIACDLERRSEAVEIPAVRAVRKLFLMLDESARDETASVKVSELADLIKSEYFRLETTELASLAELFATSHGNLLTADENHEGMAATDDQRRDRLRRELGIGAWDPDGLENTIAYVGKELRVNAWLERAHRLLAHWPQVKATTELVTLDNDSGESTDSATGVQESDRDSAESREKQRRPSREMHPAAIAWATLVLARLAQLLKEVPREGEPRKLRKGVAKLLDQLQFQKQISRPIRKPFDESELPLLMVDLSGLEALRRAFAAAGKSIEMATAVVATNKRARLTRLTTFLNEVVRSLGSQVQVGSPGARGGLRVLEATDVRGLKFRALFVAGLVEGGFPLRASRDWIYPHEERERLQRCGLTLEDISPATLLKEEHYFYQAACRATDRLYLSRPLLLEDGSETVVSYYVDEVRRAIKPFVLAERVVRRDLDGGGIWHASTTSELAISLVRQEERSRRRATGEGLLPPAKIDELVSWATELGYISPATRRRLEIERERSSTRFGPYDGAVTDKNLLAMLANQFGSDFVHSASGLSIYGNCPYKFFASRVLKLEPRGESALDLPALDAGKLLHDVLRRFFERHRNQRLSRDELCELRRELGEVADEVFDEHERVVPPLNSNIWKIDREIRKIILDQVLIFELGVQDKTLAASVRPAYFEVAFGMNPRQAADPVSNPGALVLRRAGSGEQEQIKIQGQIDRIDASLDGTLIAYDYKLSSGSNIGDMKAGRSLQLPIYLEALERLILPRNQIAGAGYYILRGGSERRNKGLYRASYSDYTRIQAKNSIFSDDEWQQIRDEVIAKVWEFLDGMRAGRFIVTPSEGYKTCRFCDYAAVCRYDKYRIQRKLDPTRDESSG